MVSRSTTWISPKPVVTRFLRSSHPIPPAPTTRMRDCGWVSKSLFASAYAMYLLDVAVERAERLFEEPVARHCRDC